MTMILRPFLLLGFFTCLLWSAAAQPEGDEIEDEQEAFSNEFLLLSGYLTVGVPIGNFKEKLNTVGVGGGGALLIRIKEEAPVYAGFELSGFTYDRESDIFLLALDNGDLVDVEMETRTNIFTGHGLLRVAPPTKFFIKPYFDAMVGFKNLFTKTLFFDLNSGDDEPFDRNIEKGDWAFSYGAALGLQLPLKSRVEGLRFLLDFRCAYLKGSAADYFVRRDDLTGVTIEEPLDVFEEKNSTTDLLMPQLGFIISFGKNRNALEEELVD